MLYIAHAGWWHMQAVASRLGDTSKYPMLSEYKAIYSGNKDHSTYLDTDPEIILDGIMDMPQHQGKLLHKEGSLDALAVVAAMTIQSAVQLDQVVCTCLTFNCVHIQVTLCQSSSFLLCHMHLLASEKYIWNMTSILLLCLHAGLRIQEVQAIAGLLQTTVSFESAHLCCSVLHPGIDRKKLHSDKLSCLQG